MCSYSAKVTRELSCTLTVLSDESCTFRPKKEREEQTIYERTVSRQARDRFASLFSAWSAISSFSKLKFRIICQCSGESLGGIVSRKCYGGIVRGHQESMTTSVHRQQEAYLQYEQTRVCTYSAKATRGLSCTLTVLEPGRDESRTPEQLQHKVKTNAMACTGTSIVVDQQRN